MHHVLTAVPPENSGATLYMEMGFYRKNAIHSFPA